MRPWGLVVERNPFVEQPRLAAPRAIPSLSELALSTLQQAASMFKRLGQEDAATGDWRYRTKRMRSALNRYRVVESLFFAEISSHTLEALRGGPKWRSRCRQELEAALEPADDDLRFDHSIAEHRYMEA